MRIGSREQLKRIIAKRLFSEGDEQSTCGRCTHFALVTPFPGISSTQTRQVGCSRNCKTTLKIMFTRWQWSAETPSRLWTSDATVASTPWQELSQAGVLLGSVVITEWRAELATAEIPSHPIPYAIDLGPVWFFSATVPRSSAFTTFCDFAWLHFFSERTTVATPLIRIYVHISELWPRMGKIR